MQLEAARILRRKLYFSRERQAQEQGTPIEQVLFRHLKLDTVSAETMGKLETPHDKVRYLLLQQIGIREQANRGFEILEAQNIAAFIDALIVAQTFNANPGANANSLPFPFPSTTTGAVRSKAGSDEHGNFIRSPEEVLKLKVRGPLLVQLPPQDAQLQKIDDTEDLQWLLPAPADAQLLKPGKDVGEQESVKATLIRLQPLDVKDTLTDLDALSSEAEHSTPLMLVGPTEVSAEEQKHAKREKPLASSQVPAFWKWSWFRGWLLNPPRRTEVRKWSELGIFGLPSEQRIHITFDRDQHAARDEALFETNGREFTTWDDKRSGLNAARQLALAVIVDEGAEDNQGEKLAPHAGVGTLGGERRIARWRSCATLLPACPLELIEQVVKDRACRIILLTPAYFAHGCYPKSASLRRPHIEVTPTLRALAVDRPQVVSGWDFARNAGKGEPKPTRHLTPAGSVLFLELNGEKADIERWVQATWLQCIDDDEPSRNDGFGLAVIGTWNREPEEEKRS